MWNRVLVTCFCLVPTIAYGEDNWSDPYPGVRRLHRVTANQNINVLVADLCAPGVGVRGTATGERGRTVPSFGSAVGAAAAVNGDFFVSGYSTDGPSRHAGAGWGGADHGYVAPLMFGPHRAALPPHESTAGVPGWATEVVSGHPSIVIGGNYRDNNGDPLCSNRHPRTAAGLSADRKKLILAVVDGRASTRIGMNCGELAALMQEMGAHDVVNLDGGGSSTMWLGNAGVVNRPSDGSPRVVGNHFALFATGSGDAPFCPSAPPVGFLDSASCDQLVGWAQDPDAPDAATPVEVWVGGPPGSDAPHFSAIADVHRDDLCAAIGSCKHGFSIPTPPRLRDNTPRELWIEGTDNLGVTNAVLANAPQSITCEHPVMPWSPSTGQLRWIPNPEAFAAWRWSGWDIAMPPQTIVGAYTEGPQLPLVPDLVRVAGSPAVYVVDGMLLRHVTSPEVMAAWRFPSDSVREISETDFATVKVGAPWPDRAYLVQDQSGSGKVLLVDTARPEDPGSLPENPVQPPGGGPNDLVSGGCSTSGSSGSLVLGLALLGFTRRRRLTPR